MSLLAAISLNVCTLSCIRFKMLSFGSWFNSPALCESQFCFCVGSLPLLVRSPPTAARFLPVARALPKSAAYGATATTSITPPAAASVLMWGRAAVALGTVRSRAKQGSIVRSRRSRFAAPMEIPFAVQRTMRRAAGRRRHVVPQPRITRRAATRVSRVASALSIRAVTTPRRRSAAATTTTPGGARWTTAAESSVIVTRHARLLLVTRRTESS